MSGKIPPSLTADFYFFIFLRQSRKLNIPIFRIDLFKSSLVYSGSVLWNSLPDPALKRLNCVTCHTLCADCLSLHVKLSDCNLPAMFYLTAFSILLTFTQHLMFATYDFKASIPAYLISCLMSKLHLFHVYTCVS